ncbi:MAG: hypothetical protein QNJ98_12040 [Planctomycetota bacterium]|nr:hypothetical protein [Planctomycetota bacterium]
MSRLPFYALALLLIVGLALPATFAEEEPAAPAPAKPKEEAKPKDEEKPAEEAKPEGPVIKIVEAGAEPRKEIRFKPTAGSKITTDASLLAGFNFGGMGGEMDIAIIADMTIDKGSKDGQFKLSGSLTKCEMKDDPNNPMAGQIKPMIDGLKGISFSGEYTEMGKWTANPAENLKGVPPQSAQLAQMVAVVFGGIMVEVPKDALGVGASWTSTRDDSTEKAESKTLATYKIEKIEGDRITLSFTSKQTATNQKLSMMGMEINVLKRTIDGSGTMTLDLALGVANVGTLKINSVQETDAMGNMENTFDGKQTTKAAAAATSETK